mgnify:CR=1 FL=1
MPKVKRPRIAGPAGYDDDRDDAPAAPRAARPAPRARDAVLPGLFHLPFQCAAGQAKASPASRALVPRSTGAEWADAAELRPRRRVQTKFGPLGPLHPLPGPVRALACAVRVWRAEASSPAAAAGRRGPRSARAVRARALGGAAPNDSLPLPRPALPLPPQRRPSVLRPSTRGGASPQPSPTPLPRRRCRAALLCATRVTPVGLAVVLTLLWLPPPPRRPCTRRPRPATAVYPQPAARNDAAIRAFYEDDKKVSLYVMGDEFSGEDMRGVMVRGIDPARAG